MGAAILKLVAVITRDFNIMDEEVPEAVVDKSDELAHIEHYYRRKTVSQELPKFELHNQHNNPATIFRSNWPITHYGHIKQGQ